MEMNNSEDFKSIDHLDTIHLLHALLLLNAGKTVIFLSQTWEDARTEYEWLVEFADRQRVSNIDYADYDSLQILHENGGEIIFYGDGNHQHYHGSEFDIIIANRTFDLEKGEDAVCDPSLGQDIISWR